MTPTTTDEAALIARLNRELLYKRELARMIREGWVSRDLALCILAAHKARGGVLS